MQVCVQLSAINTLVANAVMVRPAAFVAGEPQLDASRLRDASAISRSCKSTRTAHIRRGSLTHDTSESVVQPTCKTTTRRGFLATASLVPMLAASQLQSAFAAATLTVDQLEVRPQH
jgi:hypothetical protein